MPNWCKNTLEIRGDKTNRDNFLMAMQGHEPQILEKGQKIPLRLKSQPKHQFSFDQLIPIPEEVLNGSSYWKDWCVEHWGTKWNAVNVDIDHTDQATVVSFDSAWSPMSEKLFDALCHRGRNLQITYEFESDSDYYGRMNSQGLNFYRNLEDSDFITCPLEDDCEDCELGNPCRRFNRYPDMSDAELAQML